MRSYRILLVILPLLTVAEIAVAQPKPSPGDSVTVTGAKSREVMQRFVEKFSSPTSLIGKMARWTKPICPRVLGMDPERSKFVIRRLKEVAVQIGAPVDPGTDCKANLQIVFTGKPQDFMNDTRRMHAPFLGYYDTEEQLDRLALVTHPIQGWYTTETEDTRGRTIADDSKVMPGAEIHLPCSPGPGCYGGYKILYADAAAYAVSGNRMIGNGLRSGFRHALIVVDADKLAKEEVGVLADYIVMLSLSQVKSLDTCQTLPSVVNLLAPNCAKPQGLLSADLGYLNGLYHMNPDLEMRGQQDYVAYQMEQSLAGR